MHVGRRADVIALWSSVFGAPWLAPSKETA
jgi:hypothetical protein